MLHKTKGIVLKTTNYSETSVVCQVFTEKFGIQSYLINGVKKPKAKISNNILQPLHLLEMVVYYKQNVQLQRISEARAAPIFKSIPYHLTKNTIIQFLDEVLYKSIRHQQTDQHLFEFLFYAIILFDETPEVNIDFHLIFLMKLSRFLGFAPLELLNKTYKYFDLQEGKFSNLMPVHPYFIEGKDGEVFVQLLNSDFETKTSSITNNKYRRFILDKILIFYKLHTASFGEIKSHQILEEILL